MLEILKAQYQSANTLSKSTFYKAHSPEMSQIFSELYPQCLDYFHELNPGFLFKIQRAEFLNQYSAMTVRDGSISFGAFILKNFQQLANLKTHFIIDRHLTPLVPNYLRQKFSCWQIVQKKKIKISEAQRIVITGLMNEQILPSLAKIKDSLGGKVFTGCCIIEIRVNVTKIIDNNKYYFHIIRVFSNDSERKCYQMIHLFQKCTKKKVISNEKYEYL